MDVQVISGTPDEHARWFADDLARAVRATTGHRFTLAVPGGSVAEEFFPVLAAAELPWDDVDVFWVDERAVAPTDPQSNHALASRLWLVPAGVPAARIHRMAAERADLQRAAEEYARELTAAAGSPPILDYALLGVGEDGHVASVFPGNAAGTGAETVAWTDASPKPPPRRMTLSLRTLAGARRVVIAAFGPAKAAPVRAALSESRVQSPLARLLRAAQAPVLLVEAGVV